MTINHPCYYGCCMFLCFTIISYRHILVSLLKLSSLSQFFNFWLHLGNAPRVAISGWRGCNEKLEEVPKSLDEVLATLHRHEMIASCNCPRYFMVSLLWGLRALMIQLEYWLHCCSLLDLSWMISVCVKLCKVKFLEIFLWGWNTLGDAC